MPGSITIRELRFMVLGSGFLSHFTVGSYRESIILFSILLKLKTFTKIIKCSSRDAIDIIFLGYVLPKKKRSVLGSDDNKNHCLKYGANRLGRGDFEDLKFEHF